MALAVLGDLTIANMASFQLLQTEVVFLFRSQSMVLIFEEMFRNITIGLI
jgi:hypothetical protein